MDPQSLGDILSGRRKTIGACAFRGVLAAASIPYSATMRLRRWAYRHKLLPSFHANIPVVCVGNITTGGTGKTPMVAWVVERLKEAGHAPAILTRGYKASGGKSDEADLLARLTGVPVIVNPDRAAGARQAVSGKADVLVMDDGFQHRRLRRDLDIVLIDATNPFGYDHCLPRGLLREPLSALRDAHAIVITRSDQVRGEALGELKNRLQALAPSASIHTAIHKPIGLIDPEGNLRGFEAMKGQTIGAFCGLGNPDAFFKTLSGLGMPAIWTHAFDDHQHYGPDTLAWISDQAKASGVSALVTTQKDFVKLAGSEFARRVWQLAVEMDVIEGREEFRQRLLDVSSG